MRKWLSPALVLALCSPALAIDVYIPAGACVVDGSTAQRVSHQRFVSTLQRGGSHIDLRFATNNSGGATNTELGFCDFPYPPNLPDGSSVTLTYALESAEATDGLQHCVRAQLCASVNGSDFAACNTVASNTRADVIYTTAGEGLVPFARNEIVGPTNAVIIFRSSALNACTQALCANTWVRLMLWRDDSITGCSAPSSNQFAIRGIAIH